MAGKGQQFHSAPIRGRVEWQFRRRDECAGRQLGEQIPWKWTGRPFVVCPTTAAAPTSTGIQASGHLASTEHSPLLACWSGGPSPKRGTARGVRSVESLKTQVHHIWSLRRARLGFGHMRLDCTLQQPARGYFGGHEAGGRHERRGGQAFV